MLNFVYSDKEIDFGEFSDLFLTTNIRIVITIALYADIWHGTSLQADAKHQ